MLKHSIQQSKHNACYMMLSFERGRCMVDMTSLKPGHLVHLISLMRRLASASSTTSCSLDAAKALAF